MKGLIQKLSTRVRGFVNKDYRRNWEKQVFLASLPEIKINRNLDKLVGFEEVEYSVFSQWGEDGILDWLISKLPNIPRSFVEFGVETYTEANTRFLLLLRNWRGLIIDGSKANIEEVKKQDIFWRYNLTARCSFITAENINSLIEEAKFKGEIGVLSIDIDGNDYWVWKAIEIIIPAIVIIEYNAVFGDLHQLTVPYRPDFSRSKAHFSNLYFGASLQALIQLGKSKGYKFIGTCSAGVNAFFLRDDLTSEISGFIDDYFGYPSVFRESRDRLGRLSFLNGNKRMEEISNMPIVDLSNNCIITLQERGEIYSSEWKLSERRSMV